MSIEWVHILKDAGYPRDVLVLDFESYFDKDYTLSKLSTVEYIQDQRFEALGVACLHMSANIPHAEPKAVFWPDVEGQLGWLQNHYGQHLEQATVVCQNARFDVGVLTYRYNIRPPHVIDTLGLARHLAARKKNDLATLCQRYDLLAKGDTKQFEGLHRGAMTQAQQKNLAAYAENDAAREWELFTILLPMLTRPEVELRLAQHTLTMFMRPLFTFDFNKAEEITAEMVETEAKILSDAGHIRSEISGTISFEKLVRFALGDEEPPTKKGKKKTLLAIAATDPGREYLLNHEKPEVRSLMQSKIAIATWPKNVRRVGKMVAQAKACGGFLAAPLRYYGAHTGRWSGDEKINLHNLIARSPHACINAIRHLLTAPPGYVLVITDASQIEARNLGWQAGQDDLVQAFAEGRQIYCEFVSEILERRIRKPLPIDPPIVVKYLKHYRMLGKVGILGAGYGMGIERCLVYAHDVYHIDIDLSMAEKLITHYRQKNDKICKLWRDVEDAFKYVVRYPEETCELDRGLTFRNEDHTVILGLPSGRSLFYHSPYIRKDGKGRDQLCMPDERKVGAEIRMWGGYLCLAGDTLVLTDSGWLPIDQVKWDDQVWDGEQWVEHDGLVCQGKQAVIDVNGIRMTPGHKILTTRGWYDVDWTANGLDWETVWLPDGTSSESFGWSQVVVGRAMSVRERANNSDERTDQERRSAGLSFLFDEGQECIARHVATPGILGLAFHARSLSVALTSGMEKLRWAWNQGVRTVGRVVRGILERHGADISARADVGSNRQRRKLRTKQLPMGNLGTTGQQQAVFDLLNCGPHCRFVVQDGAGIPRLVHNCENIIQATSRDILGEAILDLEGQGWPIALHVHDEVVLVVPEEQGDEALAASIASLRKRPTWAPDLPLDAEGFITQRYGK